MPLSILIALLLLGVMYDLIQGGVREYQAIGLILGAVLSVLLLVFSIIWLVVRDKAKFEKQLKTEIQKCINEMKEFLGIKSGGKD